MKLWSTEHTFSHPWKKVTEAAWKKYPNELNTNVRSIDVLDRVVLDGKLVTTRIFGSQWNLPNLITALFGLPDMCYAVERSEVDMKNEKMTLRMINYTFWGFLAVEEKLVYEPHGASHNETSLTQAAKIQINGVQFSNYFEGVIASNFESTSLKGRKALELMLNKIQIEKLFKRVGDDIQEISAEIDRAASYLSEEFRVKERIQELSNDLENASAIINNEIKICSTTIQHELTHLQENLNSELNLIQAKLTDGKSRTVTRVSDAVKQAGLTARSS